MRNKSSRLNYFCKTFLGLACALFFLSACDVTFVNPLPDSLAAGRDERLLGRWMTRDDNGRVGYVRLDARSKDEIIIHFETDD